MKAHSFTGVLLFLILFFPCCGSPVNSDYRPLPPELPAAWREILGEPLWRFEWVGEDGNWHKKDFPSGTEAISFFREWTVPVLAWPFWPERNLLPGMMRPAGALFPWDALGENIVLSWKGGVDALFWKELAGAASYGDPIKERFPWRFDWPGFRELKESENMPVDFRADPWTVDWKEAARRTVETGFDRRRIVPRKFTETAIPFIAGTWVSSSPFAPAMDVPEGVTLTLKTSAAPDTWVSAAGILRCSASGWTFLPASAKNGKMHRTLAHVLRDLPGP